MSGYKNFSEYDLICDVAFIEWMLAPTDESDDYWARIISDNPDLSPVIDKARTLFRNSVRLSDYGQTDAVIERLFEELSMRISAKKQRIRMWRKVTVGLAAAVCAAVAIILIPPTHQPQNDYVFAVRQVDRIDEAPEGEVTLLSDNAIFTIGNNSDIILDDLLSSLPKEVDVAKTSNIQLIVPRGRQSSIRLNDGTVVWVNAGSRVSFPEKFNNNEREITIDGEVYLIVAKDESHPFIVNAGGVKIKVLGTEFGITAYGGDDMKSVVLVSGSVEVCMPGGEQVRLRPHQRMVMSDNGYDIATVDVMEYVSWKNGWLQTNSTNLYELMMKISRYYDREIVCDDAVRNLTCSGKLLLSDDIEIILKVISRNMDINYTIAGNKIILHP